MADTDIKPKVVVAALVYRDGGIILQQRAGEVGGPNGEGRWEIPGGKWEKGETLEEAVIREVEEETGLTVSILGLVHARITNWESGPHLILFYACVRESGVAPDVKYVRFSRLEEYDPLPGVLDAVMRAKVQYGW